MEVRQLRYAVLLAEQLHFGRAADRAYITQSAFSQQIARLERELGTRLFERSPRGVSITPAGERFVEHASRVLAGLETLEAEVRALAAGAAGTLRVGVFACGAGEVTPLLFSSYRRAFPDVELVFRELSMTSQVAELVDGAVDVALLHPPIDDPRVELHPLFAEPRLAALPAQHPLAEAPSLSVEELIDEPFVSAAAGAPPAWRSFWRCDDLRGEPGRTSVQVRSVTEGLAAVAFLGGVDTFPGTAARFYRHPAVTYVPLRDGSYAAVAVAHRHGDERPLVSGFRALALRVAERHRSLVPSAVAPA